MARPRHAHATVSADAVADGARRPTAAGTPFRPPPPPPPRKRAATVPADRLARALDWAMYKTCIFAVLLVVPGGVCDGKRGAPPETTL